MVSDEIERLAQDMCVSWRRGERRLAEDYLDTHPHLARLAETALELISEEISLRQEYGEPIASADFKRRFPQWRQQIEVLLDCHELLGGDLTVPAFPVAGERLGDFSVHAELGRGAHGRVFLATQPLLADRRIVLKLTTLNGHEHLALARLQHTHIVPLYSVHDFTTRHVRALCMPYFGGATLTRVLDALADCPPDLRTGASLVDALRRSSVPEDEDATAKSPARKFLASTSYPRAICWIGLCLADALQYARERGLVHLDLKPANVLLADDGQPMLLDFHLARSPLARLELGPQWLGGTPGYMAPEQELALAALRAGWPTPIAVDGRADIYSLGVLLYQALGGELPFDARRAPNDLRRSNPQVSVGLADIVGKCVAAKPQDRYQSAGAVAADLRRYLGDQPLRGVANRSLRERWQKWRRRRPHVLGIALLLLVASAGASLGFFHVQQQAAKARKALDDGRRRMDERRFQEATDALKLGLALADNLPLCGQLRTEIHHAIGLAERAQAAEELHAFVQQLRPLYGVEHLPLREAREISDRCRRLWEGRSLILERLHAQPSVELRQQLEADLLDLAICWTDVRVRAATAEEAGASRKDALNVLAQAEGLFGCSMVLMYERHHLALALNLESEAAAAAHQGGTPAPRSAWEHYALGRALLRTGLVQRAASEFERALELEPQGLWPNFHMGRCACQLGRYDDGVAAFTACIALAPESAWCRHNRGVVYMELGRLDRARADFDRALQLDPTFAAGALGRGILHYREKRYPAAIADFRTALQHGMNPSVVHYHLALTYLAQHEHSQVWDSLEQALRHDPHHWPWSR